MKDSKAKPKTPMSSPHGTLRWIVALVQDDQGVLEQTSEYKVRLSRAPSSPEREDSNANIRSGETLSIFIMPMYERVTNIR